ncbi:DUF6048 family protein [Flavobacterium coralii]|uniref:DUF6048 family protein n=1 Tax=Flavobacterium coralii TaxID=2838017 RepID=UPI001CA6CD5C|nr:DUF6048 family protein [Flavobacterium coralii]
MRTQSILKYFTSLGIMLAAMQGSAQVATDTVAPAETAVPAAKSERYGLRLGVDLNKIAKGFYTDDYRGLEIVGDYRLSKKLYAAAEIGNEDYTIDDRQLNFTASGSYLKVGFDYNAYENWLDMENMIYVGFRYSIASFSQTLNSYKIYDNRILDGNVRYLDEVTVISGREYSSLNAHWAEVVGGVKAEVFDNLFLGFSVRLNLLFANKKPDNFDNLYIPGYNRTYAGSFGAGFNYTVSYFIPLYKKAAKPAEKTTP